MAYIGVQPTAGQYRKLDNISASFNGSTTSFTTSVGGTNVTAGTAQQLIVSLGGVIQQPDTDYTVSTNTITFTTAPTSGLDFFAILMGDALNTVTPSDGSVTTSKLAGSLSVGLTAGSASTPALFFTGDTNNGIFSPGADQVAISTGGSGRLFIDASGRLLVGTSTARSNFFGTTLSSLTQTEGIGGSTARGALSVINNDVSNNPPYVLLGRSGAATLGSNAAVVSGSRLGTLTFHGADGTSFIEAATVAGEVDGTPGTNDMPGRLVFSTTADGAASPTERLRIDSSGRLLVGTSSTSRSASLQIVQANQAVGSGQSNVGIFTSNTQALDIGGMLVLGGQSGEANWVYGSVSGRSENNSYGGYLQFGTSTAAGVHTERMRIVSDGRFYSVPTYNNTTGSTANVFVSSTGEFARSTSSVKYKTDIELLQNQYADALLDCRPVWYRSTCKADNPAYGYWGFIAEEVAEIDPRLVHWKTVEVAYDEKGAAVQTPCKPEPEGVQYDRFVPHLLNLIKRQGEAIAELQAEVAALKAQ